jgi:hypothetical protein
MAYGAVCVALLGSAGVLSKRGRDVCKAETRRRAAERVTSRQGKASSRPVDEQERS